MPLTMRPTGLASPVDKDRQDFTIYCGGLAMGIFGAFQVSVAVLNPCMNSSSP
jgi:hypothetical protein